MTDVLPAIDRAPLAQCLVGTLSVESLHILVSLLFPGRCSCECQPGSVNYHLAFHRVITVLRDLDVTPGVLLGLLSFMEWDAEQESENDRLPSLEFRKQMRFSRSRWRITTMYSLSINVTDRVCLPEDIDSCLVSEMLVEVYADRAVAELITVTVGIDVSVRRKQSGEHLEDLLMIIRYQRQ